MKTRRAFIAALLALSAARGIAAELPATERTYIEALLTHIENLKDATFIRNGSDYDAKSAAKFLRKKFEAHGKDVTTAAAFIEKIATQSSTSGQPYLLRFKDGRERKSGDYLKAELEKLTKPSGKQ